VDSEASDSIVLLRRAHAGEREAYESLFARYYPRVLAIARARLGGTLEDFLEVEDLAQDAMMQAIAAFDRFELRDDASLIGWFARIVENRIRDTWRRANVRLPLARGAEPRVGDAGDASAPQFERAASQTGALSGLIRREEAELLQRCLTRLEPQQRELILQRTLQGRAWGEIAGDLGFPTADAARMAFARAKLVLAEVLAGLEEGPAGRE
jgi:RNA polymerase sigma-70 factor (ECF subfamily)